MVGPDYERPEVEVSDSWHTDLAYKNLKSDPLGDTGWTEIFQDEQLQMAVEEALKHNKSLLIAIENIEQARAANVVSRSRLFPTVDLELHNERENESGLTNVAPNKADEFFLGAAVGWELDLWGRNRRANNAAYARYLAAEYGAQAVRISLVADVSRAYFELQGVESRLGINNDTLDAREQAVGIANKRHKGGLTSKLEVIQSEVELASAKASIPGVEQRKLVVENQLSFLLGKPPQHIVLNRQLEDQYLPTKVTAGLPANLLNRRPDTMKAEQKLIAASESVGYAHGRLYPRFNLTGSLGYETQEFGDLLDSDGRFWIIELDVIMPLFNSGARRAELSAAESRFNQARLNYEQTVLNSLREVSDALNAFYKSGESLKAQLELETATAAYLHLAQIRYRNGVLAYLDVLDARRGLFTAQIAVSNARQAQLFALVDLYKALGGGWDQQTLNN